MTLLEHVTPALDKLNRRIQKEGLRDLSFLEYDRYLNTALWSKIKEWIYERDGLKCQICQKVKESRLTDMDVHHRSYDLEVLEGRRDDMLITLCRRCHHLVEYFRDGRKRSCLEEKDAELHRLKVIYSNIAQHGIQLNLSVETLRRRSRITIQYAGDNDCKIFYPLESFLFSFVLATKFKYRGQLRLPLPFGIDKFYQKSGARVYSTVTNKEAFRVHVENGNGVILSAINPKLSINEEIIAAITESSVWRLEIEDKK